MDIGNQAFIVEARGFKRAFISLRLGAYVWIETVLQGGRTTCCALNASSCKRLASSAISA